MTRPRRVSRAELEAFLEDKQRVTFLHLRNHFSEVEFDPETAYRWLTEAGWQPVHPRRREVWERRKNSLPAAITRARFDLGEALTRAGATARASSAGVVITLPQEYTSASIAVLFHAAQLDDVDFAVPAPGGTLLSVHPGTQSEVVRAISRLMASPGPRVAVAKGAA